MIKGERVTFGASKTLSYVRQLGAGGTGTTFLFHDDLADVSFAIKKYDPKAGNDSSECFRRFIEEIKLSLRINHPNIVRTYDYFLYPNQLTGYLMMEYIDGVQISDYDPSSSGGSWDAIFGEAISAFEAIEAAGMLHRDIRPSNFLIDNSNKLKVIDFGFGKQLSASTVAGTSVLLNWPGSAPLEVYQGIYTHATDIYYLGMLFMSLANLQGSRMFSYKSVLQKMTERNPADRYRSFSEVKKAMLENNAISFTDDQQKLYLMIAEVIEQSLSEIHGESLKMRSPQAALGRLKSLVDKTCLEEQLQDISLLINCFISNGYLYHKEAVCYVSDLRDFYLFFAQISDEGREAVLNNLSIRLRKINITQPDYDDDIPF